MEISQYSEKLFVLVVLVDVLHPSSYQLGSSRFISGCRRPIQLSVMCVYVVFFCVILLHLLVVSFFLYFVYVQGPLVFSK
jgi:hypothetical protein